MLRREFLVCMVRRYLSLTLLCRSLQAKQYELERQQQSDSLRKHLEKRPEREELVERKFLYGRRRILGLTL